LSVGQCLECQAPRTNLKPLAEMQSAPSENFLATVLVWSQSQSLRFEFWLRSAALGCCSLSYWKCIC